MFESLKLASGIAKFDYLNKDANNHLTLGIINIIIIIIIIAQCIHFLGLLPHKTRHCCSR